MHRWRRITWAGLAAVLALVGCTGAPEPDDDQFPWHERPTSDSDAMRVPVPSDSDDPDSGLEELPEAPMPTPVDEVLDILLRNDGVNVIGIHDVSRASRSDLNDMVLPQARIESSFDSGSGQGEWQGYVLPMTLRADGSVDIFEEKISWETAGPLDSADMEGRLRNRSLDGEIGDPLDLGVINGPRWFSDSAGRCGDAPWLKLHSNDGMEVEFRGFGSASGVLVGTKDLDLDAEGMYYDINFGCTTDHMVYGVVDGWSSMSEYQEVFTAPLGEPDQAVKLLDAGMFDVVGEEVFGVEIEQDTSTVYEFPPDGGRTPLLTLPGKAKFGWTDFTASPTHLVFSLMTTQSRANLGGYAYANAEILVFFDRETRDMRVVQHLSPTGMNWWRGVSVGSTYAAYALDAGDDGPVLHVINLEDGSIVSLDHAEEIWLAGEYVGYFDYSMLVDPITGQPLTHDWPLNPEFVIARWADTSGDT